jgi:hypothetical protein
VRRPEGIIADPRQIIDTHSLSIYEYNSERCVEP